MRELSRLRRGKRRAFGIAAIVSILLISAVYASCVSLGHQPALEDVTLLLVYLLSLVVISRVVGTSHDYLWRRERRAVTGAMAGEKIVALLKNLPADHVVLHDLDTGRGNIDHLIIRKDGAIFLIETQSFRGAITEQNGELLRDGRPFAKNLLKQNTNCVYWLQQFLKARLGSKLWINSAIVFPDASVEVRGKVKGVQIISAVSLKRWMWRTGGNPYIAAIVWPHVKKIQNELLEQSEKNLLR